MGRASRAAQLLMRAASWATQPLRIKSFPAAGATRVRAFPWTNTAGGESIGGRLALERTHAADATAGSRRSAHSWERPPLGSEAARRATGQKTVSWKVGHTPIFEPHPTFHPPHCSGPQQLLVLHHSG